MDRPPTDRSLMLHVDAESSKRASEQERPRIIGAPLGDLLVAMASDDADLREEAWAECYRQYSKLVWTRVLYVVRTIPWLKEPQEVAMDVTSTVFLGLPDAARKYRDQGKAEQWLKRVAVRTALRHKQALTGRWAGGGGKPDRADSSSAPRQSKGRTGAGSQAVGRMNVDFDDAVDSICGLLDDVEQDERLELSRRLDHWRGDPSKQRYLDYIALHLEGYGHEEIAERLGITAATSRNWLWKIRQELGKPPATERES